MTSIRRLYKVIVVTQCIEIMQHALLRRHTSSPSSFAVCVSVWEWTVADPGIAVQAWRAAAYISAGGRSIFSSPLDPPLGVGSRQFLPDKIGDPSINLKGLTGAKAIMRWVTQICNFRPAWN